MASTYSASKIRGIVKDLAVRVATLEETANSQRSRGFDTDASLTEAKRSGLHEALIELCVAFNLPVPEVDLITELSPPKYNPVKMSKPPKARSMSGQ